MKFQITDLWGGLNLDMKISRLDSGALPGRVKIPAGTYFLGSRTSDKWYLDWEREAHPVRTRSFSICKAPVTNCEYLQFVENDGYRIKRYWSFEAWKTTKKQTRMAPEHWKNENGKWYVRYFDKWRPLEEVRNHPVCHVTWHEAEAYCRFVGGRLPTEAEWEIAAGCVPDEQHGYRQDYRVYTWGNDAPTPSKANTGFYLGDFADVASYPESDSPFGCRQMIGNIYEWTKTTFFPFPGYVMEYPYREASAPWFGFSKVCKGGALHSGTLIARIQYRNFYPPNFNKTYVGFRVAFDHQNAKL